MTKYLCRLPLNKKNIYNFNLQKCILVSFKIICQWKRDKHSFSFLFMVILGVFIQTRKIKVTIFEKIKLKKSGYFQKIILE